MRLGTAERVGGGWRQSGFQTPDSACHYPIVIVPPGSFQNLFQDTSSCLFGLRLHQVSVFAFDLVRAGLCVYVRARPLFLVIFVSLADGWGASP